MTENCLNVFFEQTRVGILALDKNRIFTFQYDKKWLESSQRFSLSVSLPMQQNVFTGDTVRAFFSNLLPESAAREKIAGRLGLSPKNDFILLRQLGGDCAGAISLLPDAHMPSGPDQYAFDRLSDRQLADCIRNIPVRPLLAGEDDIRISLAGAQEKLVLFEQDNSFFIPLNTAPSNCILKPEMAHFAFSIENECFCMMLARNIGLPVPKVRILTKQGQKALVIQRYDRTKDAGVVKRLHQEDFCQAMGLSHELKYQAEGGPGLAQCVQLIRDHSANPVKDIQLLLKWVFFNFITGNMDGHAKNLSFLYHYRQIRLAPFYDLLCTDVYPGLSKKLAMKIGGENRPDWIMERHWDRFANDMKISPTVLKKHLAAFCVQIRDAIKTTVTDFSKTYGENDLIRKICMAAEKRIENTMKRLP